VETRYVLSDLTLLVGRTSRRLACKNPRVIFVVCSGN